MKPTATYEDRQIVKLLGGYYYHAFTATQDQMEKLSQIYRFDLPKCPANPLERWNETGKIRNLFRHVEHDGLRVMAFLSRFLEPDEDPVAFVAKLCADAGFDCPMVEKWPEEK